LMAVVAKSHLLAGSAIDDAGQAAHNLQLVVTVLALPKRWNTTHAYVEYLVWSKAIFLHRICGRRRHHSVRHESKSQSHRCSARKPTASLRWT
jgi:hypothetical protein